MINIILHWVVVTITPIALAGASLLTILNVRRKIPTSEHWKIFNSSLVCIFLSEIIDTFTPIYQSEWGFVNFESEILETIGLALLSLSLIIFTRRFIEKGGSRR